MGLQENKIAKGGESRKKKGDACGCAFRNEDEQNIQKRGRGMEGKAW